ncbi:MAG: VacJ family lipoprotein [Thermodesulfobacteriota bacterium]
MRSLPVILAILALLAVGCAHQPVQSDQPVAAAPAAPPQAEKKAPAKESGAGEKKTAETGGELSDEEVETLLGDELEFLGDEDLGPDLEVADPLYHWNRAWFYFNDGLYYHVLEPAARGYKVAVPYDFRLAFRNFFHNLGFPVRFVSSLLQGKGGEAGAELGSFLINSTLGVLGFGSPAQDVWHIGEDNDDEDLGQTLGVWGFGEGFYLVWPVLGPSSLRDSVGLAGDYFLDPLTYVEPTELSMGLRAFDVINSTSFRLGDYESMKDFALDPYVSMRNFYIQMRRKRVDR